MSLRPTPDGVPFFAVTQELRKFFTEVIGRGDEGIIVKGANSIYEPGRKRQWLKVKTDYMEGGGDSAEYAVIGGSFDTRETSYLNLDQRECPHLMNVFYVGCKMNKEEVDHQGADAHFNVVFKFSAGFGRKDLITFCDALKPSRSLRYHYSIATSSTPEWIFPDPPVVELIGGGFQKKGWQGGKEEYWVLRAPRLRRQRHELTWKDCVTFEELQELGEQSASPTESDIANLDAWVEKLDAEHAAAGRVVAPRKMVKVKAPWEIGRGSPTEEQEGIDENPATHCPTGVTAGDENADPSYQTTDYGSVDTASLGMEVERSPLSSPQKKRKISDGSSAVANVHGNLSAAVASSCSTLSVVEGPDGAAVPRTLHGSFGSPGRASVTEPTASVKSLVPDSVGSLVPCPEANSPYLSKEPPDSGGNPVRPPYLLASSTLSELQPDGTGATSSSEDEVSHEGNTHLIPPISFPYQSVSTSSCEDDFSDAGSPELWGDLEVPDEFMNAAVGTKADELVDLRSEARDLAGLNASEDTDVVPDSPIISASSLLSCGSINFSGFKFDGPGFLVRECNVHVPRATASFRDLRTKIIKTFQIRPLHSLEALIAGAGWRGGFSARWEGGTVFHNHWKPGLVVVEQAGLAVLEYVFDVLNEAANESRITFPSAVGRKPILIVTGSVLDLTGAVNGSMLERVALGRIDPIAGMWKPCNLGAAV
ncbi:hypothetical protein HK104_004565 [Borealophlyctis nickersoniae]|nr:hypothetical protein HK104_004565 [Borealophlyctis nickersoniae]